MSSLIYSRCEQWIDETGEKVIMVPSPCGGIFYIDKASEELSSKYNPYFLEGGIKLGSAGLEGFARNIARLFPVMESFGGFKEVDLGLHADVYQNISGPQRLVRLDCLREKLIMGKKVLFATEKLASSFFNEWQR